MLTSAFCFILPLSSCEFPVVPNNVMLRISVYKPQSDFVAVLGALERVYSSPEL